MRRKKSTVKSSGADQNEIKQRSKQIEKHIHDVTMKWIEKHLDAHIDGVTPEIRETLFKRLDSDSRRMPARMWQTLIFSWIDQKQIQSQNVVDSWHQFCAYPIPKETLPITTETKTTTTTQQTTVRTNNASDNGGSSLFICRRCKARGTDIECQMLQTRRADEPMTQFLTCLKCDLRWKQA